MAEKGRKAAAKRSMTLDISDSKVFEAIRKRAYELYCNRGQQEGNAIQDWLEAEKQIKKELTMRPQQRA